MNTIDVSYVDNGRHYITSDGTTVVGSTQRLDIGTGKGKKWYIFDTRGQQIGYEGYRTRDLAVAAVAEQAPTN